MLAAAVDELERSVDVGDFYVFGGR